MKILKEYRFPTNPIEKAFVEAFLKGYSARNNMDLLVFGHPPTSQSPRDFLNEREQEIVVSTIQWLGSPVGQSFLDELGFSNRPHDH